MAAASQTVIVELLRAQILSWMAAVDAAGGPTDENAINTAPPDPTTSLIETSEKLFALSWMLGIDHASPASSLDLADTPDALSFKEAVAFMKSRVPVTKDEWKDLEPKLRFRAFTVAALSSHDSIEQVRRMVTTAIEEGKGVGQFWTETRALDAAGLSGDSPKYWEIVYRTNVQTAYNAGRATEFAREQPEYLEFLGIEDDRQTSICRSRTGTILPATHPYWKSNWPPLHFRCRSTVRGVYPEEVDQIRKENPEWKPDDADALRQDPTSEGFGGNPIDEGSFYKMTQGMAERARAYGLMDDIEAFASSLGIEHRDIEILGRRERPPKQTKAAPKPRKKPVVVPTVEISFQAIQDAKLRAVAEKAFKNAPDEVRAMVADHSFDFSYRLAPPRGQSYYSPSTETVVLRRSAGPDVFAHEFGHGIDFKVLSHYSRSDEFVSAFNEDLGALMDTKTGELLEMGKKLKQDLVAKGWNDLPPVSDLFSGLTSGRIEGRWGHPMRYWNMEGKREAEVFADLFALKASGETALWSELTGYVPRLCKAVENALTRR